ncbi:hypothetical protein ABBQ38_002386 [Trebouxia sp. C0009 RCD-2024]
MPGSQYMAEICKGSRSEADKLYNRSMCGIIGRIVCIGHCRKPSKRIAQNGEKSSATLCTCVNKAVQIMGQYAVRSKSLVEIAAPLAGMHSRLLKLQGKVMLPGLQL